MVCGNGVYIGNPNQTRHLNDHHRRIAILRKGLYTLPVFLNGKGELTVSSRLCVATLRSAILLVRTRRECMEAGLIVSLLEIEDRG